MCALKWHIKSLYRHLFLEDICKTQGSLKKNCLIGGKLSSQAPWPQRPKLGVRVAKGLSCDCTVRHFPPGEPPLRYRVQKRQDLGNLPYAYANCLGVRQFPRSCLFWTLHLRGGSPGEKMSNRAITAKAFSYPHTEFGALRSRRLAGKFPTN